MRAHNSQLALLAPAAIRWPCARTPPHPFIPLPPLGQLDPVVAERALLPLPQGVLPATHDALVLASNPVLNPILAYYGLPAGGVRVAKARRIAAHLGVRTD